MALNIALSPFRDVDPETQPIPRRFVGYDPKLGDEQLWNANRGAYDLDESAAEEQFATFSYDGTIRLVAELEGIESVEEDGRARKALLGRLLRRGDPVRDALVGRQVETSEEVSHLDTTEQDEVKVLANNLPVASGAVVVNRNRIAVEVKRMLPRETGTR